MLPYKEHMLGKINQKGHISINKDEKYDYIVCPEMSNSQGIMLCITSCAKFIYRKRTWKDGTVDYFVELCGNPELKVKIIEDERFGYYKN